jgi:hypothetical protein
MASVFFFSSETGLLSPPQVPTMSFSASGPKRRTVRLDDGTLNVTQALESNDPQKRLDGIREFQQWVENNHSLAGANMSKVVGISVLKLK